MHRVTLGVDKTIRHPCGCVDGLRCVNVTPHVVQKYEQPPSAIDGRTTATLAAASQRFRKRIAGGQLAKTVGGLRKKPSVGREKLDFQFVLTNGGVQPGPDAQPGVVRRRRVLRVGSRSAFSVYQRQKVRSTSQRPPISICESRREIGDTTARLEFSFYSNHSWRVFGTAASRFVTISRIPVVTMYPNKCDFHGGVASTRLEPLSHDRPRPRNPM